MSKKTTTNKRVRINNANRALDDKYVDRWQKKLQKESDKYDAVVAKKEELLGKLNTEENKMSEPETIKINSYPTIDDYTAIFSAVFPGSVAELKIKNNYITGNIYWDGFRDLCLADRIELVAILVRDPLGLRGHFLSTIFPLANGQDNGNFPTKRWYEAYGAKSVEISK